MKNKLTKEPEIHIKGWGAELWLVNKSEYCGKILYFEKGKKCSLHVHKIKDETFYLLDGAVLITLYDNEEEYKKGNKIEIKLRPGQTIHLWPGRLHRILALEKSVIIEISTQHFEEDSIRIEPGDSQLKNL